MSSKIYVDDGKGGAREVELPNLTPRKNGWRIAKLKIIGQIVVAILGLVGTALGVWAQIKSEGTNAILRATVDMMDESILPAIQGTLDELRSGERVVVDNLGLVRERVARLEGKDEERELMRRPRPGIARIPVNSMGPPSPEKIIDKELDRLILKGSSTKSLPRMDFQQIQIQAQEEL